MVWSGWLPCSSLAPVGLGCHWLNLSTLIFVTVSSGPWYRCWSSGTTCSVAKQHSCLPWGELGKWRRGPLTLCETQSMRWKHWRLFLLFCCGLNRELLILCETQSMRWKHWRLFLLFCCGLDGELLNLCETHSVEWKLWKWLFLLLPFCLGIRCHLIFFKTVSVRWMLQVYCFQSLGFHRRFLIFYKYKALSVQ